VPASSQPRWRHVLIVGAAGMAVAATLLALQFVRLSRNDLGSDPTAPFIVGTSWHLDEQFAQRRVPVHLTPGDGYDGQWFLGQAYDPLLLGHFDEGFDMPRYRARRPLDSMLGWLGGLGQPNAIPIVLLALGILSVGVGCAAAARLVAGHRHSRWWGLTFALIPGIAVAVMFGTAEALALALAAVGLSLAFEHRVVAAGVAFAGAGLTKETYLGFAAATAVYLLASRAGRLRQRIRAALWVALPGMLALGAWWIYVQAMVPASPTDDSGTSAFVLPFRGWLQAFHTIAAGHFVADAPVGPMGPALVVGTFVLLVAALVASLLLLRRGRRPLLAWNGLLFSIYGLCLNGGVLGTRFLSGMRTLAPCVLPCALVVIAAVGPVRGIVQARPGRLAQTPDTLADV
jgi:hypothetical protein